MQGAVRFKLPYVVIGLGTNILVSDEGFRGLLIRNYSPQKVHVEGTQMWAPSVVSLSRVVEAACLNGLTGMEFATGIPGTMGGAIYINAGAFGASISDRITWVKVITPSGKTRKVRSDKFGFGYRESRLKYTGEIALGAWLELKHGNEARIRKQMDEILALRASKHPPYGSKNAGSYFKNVDPEKPGERRQAAGMFLEKAGAKRLRKGRASVYHGHANFIINEGRAKARDVLELAEILKKRVYEKFGIRLKEEVRYLDAEHGFKKGS